MFGPEKVHIRIKQLIKQTQTLQNRSSNLINRSVILAQLLLLPTCLLPLNLIAVLKLAKIAHIPGYKVNIGLKRILNS